METFTKILKTFDLVPFDVLMIGVTVVLFLLLWAGLAKGLFLPYMALLAEREASTSGAEESAATVLKSADELRREYDAKLLEARVRTLKEKAAALDVTKQQAGEVVKKAEEDAQEILRSARWEMAQKVDATKAEAFRDADRLAEQIAQKVLVPARTASVVRARG